MMTRFIKCWYLTKENINIIEKDLSKISINELENICRDAIKIEYRNEEV